MPIPRIVVFSIALAAAAACVDSKSENADTSRPVFRNTGEAAHVDMVRIDSMAAKPSPKRVVSRRSRGTLCLLSGAKRARAPLCRSTETVPAVL